MFKSHSAAEALQEFWIDPRRLPQATPSNFYRKLDATLEGTGFAAGCARRVSEFRLGRWMMGHF